MGKVQRRARAAEAQRLLLRQRQRWVPPNERQRRASKKGFESWKGAGRAMKLLTKIRTTIRTTALPKMAPRTVKLVQ
jgi:hypothetical protein